MYEGRTGDSWEEKAEIWVEGAKVGWLTLNTERAYIYIYSIRLKA